MWSTEMSRLFAKSNFNFSIQPICVLKISHIGPSPNTIRHLVAKIGQYFYFLNTVKHKNLSNFLVYKSKSILTTSNSFPLILSHIDIRSYEEIYAEVGWKRFVCGTGLHGYVKILLLQMVMPLTHFGSSCEKNIENWLQKVKLEKKKNNNNNNNNNHHQTN